MIIVFHYSGVCSYNLSIGVIIFSSSSVYLQIMDSLKRNFINSLKHELTDLSHIEHKIYKLLSTTVI